MQARGSDDRQFERRKNNLKVREFVVLHGGTCGWTMTRKDLMKSINKGESHVKLYISVDS